jgi:hypothetical protein
MIPVRVIPTIIFAAVVYFMVGFQVLDALQAPQ